MLSFVVPCRDVAPYIDDCLRSILDQSGRTIEVVVVDDASTDPTMARVQSIADGDDRIRILVNVSPQGPGAARNRGMAAARGSYVWFVDGDDWLPAGSIAAVLDRLADGEPDVLVVDHVRVYPSGRVVPSEGGEELETMAGSSFRIADRPEMTRVLHTPWNKVVRRAMLVDHGIRFGPAPVYEDLTFSFATMRAAGTIVALPRACYAYRTGRPGALTRRAGLDHLCWAREWDIVLTAGAEDPPSVRAETFARMVWHGWEVLSPRNGRRIPLRYRRRFHRAFASLHRRHAPTAGVRGRPPALRYWPLAELRVVGSLLWWAARRSAGLMRYPFVKTTSVIPAGGPSSGTGA